MPDAPSVILRARIDGDEEVLFRIASELETWEERSPAPPAPLTRAAFDRRLARSDEDDSGDNVRFIIEADGTAVGSIGLFGFDTFVRHAEVGITLVREARGRGIGTEAIRQVVEFGFVRRNLHRIHLQAIASNTGALRAYERAGFVVEGRQREHAWVRGAYEDIVLMAILRSEWQPVSA
ncbi:GNAT family protein [Amnibacterium sp. CER49]|uniref:GNAT family N-acetyltransferase n=1 Tax=Amnibacterium sp. CER49 TaxID=3039161 RepID=UPI0024487F80|nr:GNAT family protein [Amnibacterium sp. CER49]MDH2445147.1 GNAT family protein [Amnibacterium sp. CER49]